MNDYLIKFTTEEDPIQSLVTFQAEDVDHAVEQLEAYLESSKPIHVRVYKCSLVYEDSPEEKA